MDQSTFSSPVKSRLSKPDEAVVPKKMTGKKEWTDFSSYLEDICVIVPYYSEVSDLDLGHGITISGFIQIHQSNFQPILLLIVLTLLNLRI